MVIQFLGRQWDALSARSSAFFHGFLQGLLDGVRDGAEDTARHLLARLRKVIDALRALWKQRPDEAARLIEHAIKGLPADERKRLNIAPPEAASDEASDTPDALDRWHNRGYRAGHALGHRAFDQVLALAMTRGLSSFRLGRQIQVQIGRAKMISSQLVTMSGLISKVRVASPSKPATPASPEPQPELIPTATPATA